MTEVTVTTWEAPITTWIHLLQRVEEVYPDSHVDADDAGHLRFYLAKQSWEQSDIAFFEMLVNTDLIAHWGHWEKRTK